CPEGEDSVEGVARGALSGASSDDGLADEAVLDIAGLSSGHASSWITVWLKSQSLCLRYRPLFVGARSLPHPGQMTRSRTGRHPALLARLHQGVRGSGQIPNAAAEERDRVPGMAEDPLVADPAAQPPDFAGGVVVVDGEALRRPRRSTAQGAAPALEGVEPGILAPLQPVDVLVAPLGGLGLPLAHDGPPVRGAARAGVQGRTLRHLRDVPAKQLGQAVLARAF